MGRGVAVAQRNLAPLVRVRLLPSQPLDNSLSVKELGTRGQKVCSPRTCGAQFNRVEFNEFDLGL